MITNEDWGCYFIETDVEMSSLPHEFPENNNDKIIIIVVIYYYYVASRR